MPLARMREGVCYIEKDEAPQCDARTWMEMSACRVPETICEPSITSSAHERPQQCAAVWMPGMSENIYVKSAAGKAPGCSQGGRAIYQV